MDSTHFPIAGQHISSILPCMQDLQPKDGTSGTVGGQGLMKQTCRSPTHRHRLW